MYHDTIHIELRNSDRHDINFDYNFFISKYQKDLFSSIKYQELLDKFKDIGFNIKYLKFNDIDEDEIVYCTYNFQPNFNVFFKAYKKLIKHKNFNITFEYGVIINGKFVANNMNTFAGVWFQHTTNNLGNYTEDVIDDKILAKSMELYQVVDKNGNIIATDIAKYENDFKQNFFERYEVKVALRKYKLGRLKLFSE